MSLFDTLWLRLDLWQGMRLIIVIRAATVLVSVLGVAGTVMERKRTVRAPRGYAMVGEMLDDYDDNKTCVEEDFET